VRPTEAEFRARAERSYDEQRYRECDCPGDCQRSPFVCPVSREVERIQAMSREAAIEHLMRQSMGVWDAMNGAVSEDRR